MADEDDLFVREVNEELRQDRASAFWSKWGKIIIGGAVAIVVAVGGVRFYQYYTAGQAGASGDRFLVAIQRAEEGETEDALAMFEALQTDGYGSYPLLARMQVAALKAQADDIEGAIADYDAVANDTNVTAAIRDMAKLRAGYLLVDTGSYDDVAERVEVLSATTNPLRHSAREALGLAAWKAGRNNDALQLFESILEDQSLPVNLRERSSMMAELLRGSGASN